MVHTNLLLLPHHLECCLYIFYFLAVHFGKCLEYTPYSNKYTLHHWHWPKNSSNLLTKKYFCIIKYIILVIHDLLETLLFENYNTVSDIRLFCSSLQSEKILFGN